jgi:enoyl-CoA hydratase/carnithine racemase
MKKHDEHQAVIHCDIQGRVAVLYVKEDVFRQTTDLDRFEQGYRVFQDVQQNDDVKAVLFLMEAGACDEEAYAQHLGRMSGEDVHSHQPGAPMVFRSTVERARQINIVQRWIQDIITADKLVAMGIHGCLPTPLVGVALACDLRFTTPGGTFCFVHGRFGVPPVGGAAFFLPRYVGQGRTAELLYKTSCLSAEAALELGLISEILDDENFAASCVQSLEPYLLMNSAAMISTRHLLRSGWAAELQDYFETEAHL